ncbi:MAG TPA: hypothetical protein VLI93_13480 [Acetobacteraceae bacterium]|nr:hypothetical protein [Acetobacteraceae bacterium]
MTDRRAEAQEAAAAVVDDTRTRVETTARQTATMAQDAYGQAREQALDMAAMISDSVKKQPVISLLIAGAIGCVLALLLGRR